MKKLLIAFLLAICYLSPVTCRAEDDDAFIASAVLGDDAILPDATIGDPLDFDIVETNLSLNSGASFTAVSSKDISGVFLGMPFEDVQTLFFKTRTLYTPRKKNSIIYTIPKEWKYNLDYECRQQKVFAPAPLEKCVNSLARKRGLLYPSELHLVRESTGETIEIYFTSNITDNVVWRVVYKNDANEIEGAAEKFADQRDKKIMTFWQGVLDKYGAPNSGNDKWISSDNGYDPMMTAYYGMLDLVDRGLQARDISDNVQKAKENFRAKPYSF
jgi:hypothetical protein